MIDEAKNISSNAGRILAIITIFNNLFNNIILNYKVCQKYFIFYLILVNGSHMLRYVLLSLISFQYQFRIRKTIEYLYKNNLELIAEFNQA